MFLLNLKKVPLFQMLCNHNQMKTINAILLLQVKNLCNLRGVTRNKQLKALNILQIIHWKKFHKHNLQMSEIKISKDQIQSPRRILRSHKRRKGLKKIQVSMKM